MHIKKTMLVVYPLLFSFVAVALSSLVVALNSGPGVTTSSSTSRIVEVGLQLTAPARRKRQSNLTVPFHFRCNSSTTSLFALRLKRQGDSSSNPPAYDANESSSATSKISFDNIVNKTILVVGGSGRVGGSVVCQLIKRGASHVTIGGTTQISFDNSLERWKQLYPHLFSSSSSKLDFQQVNREDETSIETVLLKDKTYDLVIHTAGPFQGKQDTSNGVLKACILQNIPYIDVCDDYDTSLKSKQTYKDMASATTAEESQSLFPPCIVSTGCWPGVSSLMAKQATTILLKENPNLATKDLSLKFSFFTAGSGGAGSTLLVATFLILAEKALKIQNDKKQYIEPMKEYENINFGKIVGGCDVAHLNLLETASIYDTLKIPNIETKFGTAPKFWNILLGWMAQLPSDLLSNESIMTKLALFSLPIVRIVDYFAGATNAMKCNVFVTNDPNINTSVLYGHENLEPCVGECVIAFAAAILSNSVVKPGIWFPEEAIDNEQDVRDVLHLASVGAHTVEASTNRSSLSSDENIDATIIKQVWNR